MTQQQVSFKIEKQIDNILKLSFFPVLHPKLEAKEILRCVCSRTQRRKAIQCQRCLYFQHENCVAKYSLKPIVNYICPECWKLELPIQSSTTFIVSPPSIKMQWNEEIQKHIGNSHFRVSIASDILVSSFSLFRCPPCRFSSTMVLNRVVG